MTLDELRFLERIIKNATISFIERQQVEFIINREIKMKLFDPNDSNVTREVKIK